METDKKAPSYQENGENDEREQKESIYYMRCALWWYFKRKYPENEMLVTEVCEMLGKLLGEEKPVGASGIGLIAGWMDQIEEIERNH